MPDHERGVARSINGSWPVLERYFETPAWRASGTDPASIISGMPWNSWMEQAGRVVQPLAAATAAAFGTEARTIGNVTGKLGFNVTDDVSIRYAQTQGSKLITAITESQRATVRTMVAESLQGQWTVDQLGRRLRGTVGLHPAWATAVSRYEDKQYARLIREGKTIEVAEATAAKRAQKKHKHLLKVRGDNIARTEIQTASNLGKFATWDAAVGKGFASPKSLKEFSPGPGACEICAPISGEVVLWDKPFSNGKMMPPFHPGCRCTANILPPDYNDPELDPDAFDWLDDTDVTTRTPFIPTLQDRIGNLSNRPAPFVAAPNPNKLLTAEQVAAKLNEETVLGTEDEMQAAGLYLGGARYNDLLREGGTINEFHQERIDQLTGFIDKQPAFGGKATLYRGGYVPKDIEVGGILEEPAFMSTSLRVEEAQIFAGDGTLMQIRTRATDRGLPINASRMRDQSGIPEEYREKLDVLEREGEILLRPGTALRVTGIETRTINGRKHRVVEADIIDAPAPAPVLTTRADDLTLQSTAHLSDDDLNDLLVELSADDPEAVDKLLEIFDQRDAAAAARKALDEAEEAALAAFKQSDDWGTIPDEFLPTSGLSGRVSRGLSADEQVKEDYYSYVQTQMSKALDDINGNFFKPQFRAKGIDETILFEGNTNTALKYASEELIAWWEENGRHTLGSFRYGALGKQEDFKRYERVLRQGFGGKVGLANDRSTF